MKPPLILVVDDDRNMRELLAHHLGQAGYRVLVAEDALVAGRHVLETPPDLMILDIEMPYMNGIDFLRLLKEDPSIPRFPVLALSAYPQHEDVVTLMGSRFLFKPIRAEVFLDAVKKALAGAESAPRPTPA